MTRKKPLTCWAARKKGLFWIRDTKKRFRDVYNYFGSHAEEVIVFVDKHVK
jgi:hypothetical protein